MSRGRVCKKSTLCMLVKMLKIMDGPLLATYMYSNTFLQIIIFVHNWQVFPKPITYVCVCVCVHVCMYVCV